MWVEEIVLEDFRCFYGKRTIEFSVDRSKNVTLIHAENGVGKTTILNAMLWCFYGMTTPRFERKDDLINHDARRAGKTSGYVEVVFEHNDSRYRARRYTSGGDRLFSIMRIIKGHSQPNPVSNPDTFINTVIPKSMASHFLFDGEHAEVFLGEENRAGIRTAVQDILGCNLIKTAMADLAETAASYRRQMPKIKVAASQETLNDQIEATDKRIAADTVALEHLKEGLDAINQQIADIDERLRNSAAAKAHQSSRDKTQKELERAEQREATSQDEIHRWLGDNGRFLVSRKLTQMTFDHLETQETRGRIPSPYNEEFVKELLAIGQCICGAPLHEGSEAHMKVSSLLEKAANHTLRSRLIAIRQTIAQMRDKRDHAPAELQAANKRNADARSDISRLQADLGEISQKLQDVNFDEIAEREKKRNQLRTEADRKKQDIWERERAIKQATEDGETKRRELRKQAAGNDEARIFVTRYNLCEELRRQLESELVGEEQGAQRVLLAGINAVLAQTGRKNFRLRMTNDYGISLVNDSDTQLAKSGGENQLLGLAFTAALVQFAKVRQNAEDHHLLRGTVAPLILDSPFGQLDESYRATIAERVPEMAAQVVLMVSGSQGSGGVISAIRGRVGKEFALIRNNKDPRGNRPIEVREFKGKHIETAVFDAEFDGTTILEIA